MGVQVVVACRTFVVGAYADFLTTIALEWDLGVAWLEPVLRVAEMGNFVEFHCRFCVGFRNASGDGYI